MLLMNVWLLASDNRRMRHPCTYVFNSMLYVLVLSGPPHEHLAVSASFYRFPYDLEFRTPLAPVPQVGSLQIRSRDRERRSLDCLHMHARPYCKACAAACTKCGPS